MSEQDYSDIEFEMRFCEQCHATVIHDLVGGEWACRGVNHKESYDPRKDAAWQAQVSAALR